jgi:predicted GNAT family acetyltransferase
VELVAHDDVRSFLEAARPVVLADEARHNLIYGICATVTEAPEAFPDFHLWTVVSAGRPVLALLMTPPWNIVVSKPADEEALRFAARALDKEGISLPGVTGALPEADAFADEWEGLTGLPRRLRMAQGVYALRSVQAPRPVDGRMRPATAEDRDLLVDWFDAFVVESVPADAPHQDGAAAVDLRLTSGGGGFAVWEDGEVVSMSGFGGETPHGIRIGPVYTPPRLRRRGYASALVAELSQKLLAEGREYCFLYTDLANPTSNRIYTDVGYELVCESADYAFT